MTPVSGLGRSRNLQSKYDPDWRATLRSSVFSPLSCGLILSTFSLTTLAGPVPNGRQHGNQAGESDLGSSFLVNAKQVNRALDDSLGSFVCQERIDRYTGRGHARHARHRDTITATLSVQDGTEQYSHLCRKGRQLRGFSELGGLWSQGEFISMLRYTEQVLATQSVTLKGEEEIQGKAALVYDFFTLAAESKCFFWAHGQRYILPFLTRVWIAEDSSQILRIAETSTQLPEALGIARVRWEVSLNQVSVNDRQWLLPSTAEYSVDYLDSEHRAWNVINFSDYHRYSAETSIRFE